jgi:hypothetical protein
MKIVVLYRPESEQARLTEGFIRDYQRQGHNADTLQVLNIDSSEGQAAAGLYGVVQYPAILALRDDGQLQRSWEGDSLPLMDEVAAYARA